jgi:ribosomal protein S18 acetylase RimI-like enzyme
MTTLDAPEVAAVTAETLALLDAHLGNPGIPDMHRERFAVQAEGGGVYLAAWQNGLPVGHVLLRFVNPHRAAVERCGDGAYVEALDVRPEHRRRGFALALMRAAEARALANDAAHVGLSVGVDNAPARALYRKLGYRSTEVPDHYVSWTYQRPDTGAPMQEGEVCSFWAKPLV